MNIPLQPAVILATAASVLLLSGAASASGGQLVRMPDSAQAEEAPSGHFTGRATVVMLFDQTAPARSYGAIVSFDPGARTHWHRHPLGQTLIITKGRGFTQALLPDGTPGPVEELLPGHVVTCPPGVMHWHGAAKDSVMEHVALSEHSDDPVEWAGPAEDPVSGN